MRTACQKSSSTETEDQLKDREKSPRLKKTPKVDRKPRSPPSGSVDDLTAQFQGFGMGCSPHGSGSSTPYSSPYGSPFPPPMESYGYYGYSGYGSGGPGTIVRTGVGNIINTTISNVGNDNSVKKIYRKLIVICLRARLSDYYGSFRRSLPYS